MTKVKLGEVVTLKKGKKAEFSSQETVNSQRYIQIDDLRNDENLKFTKTEKMTEVTPDDVLIAWDGANAGTVGYGLTGAIGSTITALKKQAEYSDILLSSYLGLFLESKAQFLRDRATGATIPHLSKDVLFSLQLPILSVKDQERIVDNIDRLEHLISKRKAQLTKLNELVKSRFNEMFGNPITNNLQLPMKKFSEVVTLQRGFDLPTQNRQSGDVNVYGSNGVVATHIEPRIREKGIVTGRSGSIGKVHVTDDEYWPLNTTLFSKELHGNNPVFLKYLLEAFRLDRFYNGTGVPTLNRNVVHKEKIICPSIDTQNEFADFVKEVDKSQLAIQKSLDELEILKKSLMQEYFG